MEIRMDRDNIIKKFKEILKEFEEKISLADEGILKFEEAGSFIIKKIREVENILTKDSREHRKFIRLRGERDGWMKVERTPHGFITKGGSNYRRLIVYQEIVKEVIKEYEPELLASLISKKNQFFFPQGDSFKGKMVVLDIMKEAEDSIVIIDPYLDETIFKYIEHIDIKIRIKLITSKVQGLFIDFLNDLKKLGKEIDTRQSKSCHDRYIILDDKVIWHLGTSINSIGKGAFQINKVVDKKATSDIFKNYKLWYKNSKKVTDSIAKNKKVKKEVTENKIFKIFKDNINIAKSKWEIEKKSNPISIYRGQEILNILYEETSDISFKIRPILDEEMLNNFDSNIIKLRKHLDYNVTMDGGKSFKNYWKIGDKIISDFKEIIHEL